MAAENSSAPPAPRGRWKRFIAPTVQITVLAAVAWFLAVQVNKEWGKISADAPKLQFDPAWLTLGGVLYLLGMLPCGLFWKRVLQAFGANPTTFETLRAYYIGHLGKYVPSKALVVVIRVALLRGRASTAAAALAVLYETLTMMAVGAILGCFILIVLWNGDTLVLATGAMVAMFAGAVVFPPMFRFLAKRAGLKRIDPYVVERLENLNFASFIVSVLGIAIGWFLMGASIWAVVRGLDPAAASSFVRDEFMYTAAAALSVVLGFVSLLPGGAGVREWALIELLGPTLAGSLAAPLVVAVMVRLVWTAAEVLLAAVLYPAGKWLAAPEALLTEPPAPGDATPAADSPGPGRESPHASPSEG